ncbi:MAG TPA: cytochrome c3 family protein [Pyrinomonadaceae bacterium]
MRRHAITNAPAPTARRRARAARRLAPVVVLLAALACVWGAAHTRAVAPAAPAPQAQSNIDFSRFKHGTREHAEKECAFCHQRAGDNSVRPAWNGRASLPGHKACIECHLPQFTQKDIPMCNICHTNLENNSNPPVKDFPGLKSFYIKFDHAQHDTGAARPKAGCADCHRPTGGRRAAALTIPARLNAHAQCYTCHTPNAQANGRDIANCGVCHAQGGYAYVPTPATGVSFRVGFSHATHGRRQGLDCANCHNLRPGARQRSQVSLIAPAQHFGNARAQNCVMCHNDRRVFNGKRVFGDSNFGDCVKCHKGATFRM